MEVEVREESRKQDPHQLLTNNTPTYPDEEVTEMVVRTEEVILVLLVLILWVAAIALFINRWGKIRMLEPYQPKFHQQPHRPSCPLAPLSPPLPLPVVNSRTQKLQNHRMSFSKYNVNALTDPLSVLPSPIIRKSRRCSAFVGGSPAMASLDQPRRAKSAIDIHHLVVNERSPTFSFSGSIIPILNRDRRQSTGCHSLWDKSPSLSRHRASVTIERPIVSLQQYKSRRSSCFVERPVFAFTGLNRSHLTHHHHHRNDLLYDRKMSIGLDRPSCSFHRPPPTFSAASRPLVLIETPTPKVSRSFEQPPRIRPKPERLANSLEISATGAGSPKTSIHQIEDIEMLERDHTSLDRSDSSHSVYIDDTKVTAPLLESLKSSDV